MHPNQGWTDEDKVKVLMGAEKLGQRPIGSVNVALHIRDLSDQKGSENQEANAISPNMSQKVLQLMAL
jgi:hypothetical protein